MNIFETVFLAAGFVTLVYLIPKASEQKDFEMDEEFFLKTAPYALPLAAMSVYLGTSMGAFSGVLLTVISLWTSLKLSGQKYLENLTFYSYFGYTAALATIPLLDAQTAFTSAAVFLPFAGATVIVSRFLNAAPVYAVAGQYFDAATSYAILSSGGEELHILGTYFVDIFGSTGIFAMKTLVVLPATLYIYKVSGQDRKLYYMFIIGFLGLAIGLANLIRP